MYGSRFFFVVLYWYLFFIAPVVRKSMISPLTYLCTFVWNQLTTYAKTISGLFILFHWSMYVFFSSVSHCLAYDNFTVNLKPGSMSPTLFLFSKLVLATLVPLHLHTIFKKSVFIKISHWIFIVLNLYINLGKMTS